MQARVNLTCYAKAIKKTNKKNLKKKVKTSSLLNSYSGRDGK